MTDSILKAPKTGTTTLHLGFFPGNDSLISSYFLKSKNKSNTFLWDYSYFSNTVLQHPNFNSEKIRQPPLFNSRKERDKIFELCKELAFFYIRKFKEGFETDILEDTLKDVTHSKENLLKKNVVKRKCETEGDPTFLSDQFYIFLLLPYYITIIPFVYAKYLCIKQYFSKNHESNFIIQTVSEKLPHHFETKKDLFANVFPNVEFQEWLSSIIIETLDLPNVALQRSQNKIRLFFTEKKKRTTFFSELKKFMRKENIIRPHRILFFFTESFVKNLPENIMSFNHIYGIGPFRSLLYSLILHIRSWKKEDSQNIDKDIGCKELSENNHIETLNRFPEDFLLSLDKIIADTMPLSLTKEGIKKILGSDLKKAASFYLNSLSSYQYRHHQTFIFDATGFYDDERTFYHLRSILEGKRLVFVQHGSNYGTTQFSWCPEGYEYYGDAFVTWGNAPYKKKYCNFVTMPSPSLSRIKDKHRFLNTSLLFVGTNQRHTNDGLCTMDPYFCIDYLKQKEIFIKELDASISSHLLYRPWIRQETASFNEEMYMQNLFSDLPFYKGPLVKKMLETRLLVLDHYGTAFYEAMAANTPVMLYFGYPEFTFMKEAETMLNDLKRVGIVHDDAKKTAQAVNLHWKNIEKWWNSKEVQGVRRSFIDLYANTDKNWHWRWMQFLWRMR